MPFFLFSFFPCINEPILRIYEIESNAYIAAHRTEFSWQSLVKMNQSRYKSCVILHQKVFKCNSAYVFFPSNENLCHSSNRLFCYPEFLSTHSQHQFPVSFGFIHRQNGYFNIEIRVWRFEKKKSMFIWVLVTESHSTLSTLPI